MQNSYFYDCLVVLLWRNWLKFPHFWDSMDPSFYGAIKEALSTSKKEMISVPVIEKPIEIDKLVKQIKSELD
jgi:hypothetical protein